jgi:hypothetical protein
MSELVRAKEERQQAQQNERRDTLELLKAIASQKSSV